MSVPEDSLAVFVVVFADFCESPSYRAILSTVVQICHSIFTAGSPAKVSSASFSAANFFILKLCVSTKKYAVETDASTTNDTLGDTGAAGRQTSFL